MEELGTAVTSANALHKGDQGAHTPSSEIASHGHLHQGPPISLHPEQLPLTRAACRLASHPGISHPTLPPSSTNTADGGASVWQDTPQQAELQQTSTVHLSCGQKVIFPPSAIASHPMCPPPPIPTVPLSSLGLLLQPHLQPCFCRSPGAASSPARRAGRRASCCTHCLARALSLPLPVDYRVH